MTTISHCPREEAAWRLADGHANLLWQQISAEESHEAIGADDGDINDMSTEAGLPRVHRAESDSDVAVYSDGVRHILVADANGPIAISFRLLIVCHSPARRGYIS